MKSRRRAMSSRDGPSEEDSDWYESDLQLAAELGKNLLDRNQELEGALRQQQGLVEEQALEIQVLSRQSAALREVNESRLRVYEQLEAGISELEGTNVRLRAETAADKKRIKSLCQSVETLEGKCLELQQLVDELKANERLRRRRDRHLTLPLAATSGPPSAEQPGAAFLPCALLQRSRSLRDHSAGQQQWPEEEDWAVKLRASVSRLKSQLSKEETTSQDLRAQVEILEQENEELQKQSRLLEEQQERLVFYHQAERFYWACRHCRRSRSGDADEDEEGCDADLLLLDPASPGSGLLSQEALEGFSTGSEEDRNRISLLSELDAQYRAIIKRYEELLRSGSNSGPDEAAQQGREPPRPRTRRDGDGQSPLLLSRSLSRELSEASDLSSGVFSSPEEDEDSPAEEEHPVEHRAVQTEREELSSGTHFKQLFEEIFSVLKRSAPEVQALKVVGSAEAKDEAAAVGAPESACKREGPSTAEEDPLAHRVKQQPSKKAGGSPRVPRVRVGGPAKQGYCVPVPPLVGCPLFKLPGHHSYAQVVRMAARAGWKAHLGLH